MADNLTVSNAPSSATAKLPATADKPEVDGKKQQLDDLKRRAKSRGRNISDRQLENILTRHKVKAEKGNRLRESKSDFESKTSKESLNTAASKHQSRTGQATGAKEARSAQDGLTKEDRQSITSDRDAGPKLPPAKSDPTTPQQAKKLLAQVTEHLQMDGKPFDLQAYSQTLRKLPPSKPKDAAEQTPADKQQLSQKPGTMRQPLADKTSQQKLPTAKTAAPGQQGDTAKSGTEQKPGTNDGPGTGSKQAAGNKPETAAHRGAGNKPGANTGADATGGKSELAQQSNNPAQAQQKSQQPPALKSTQNFMAAAQSQNAMGPGQMAAGSAQTKMTTSPAAMAAAASRSNSGAASFGMQRSQAKQSGSLSSFFNSGGGLSSTKKWDGMNFNWDSFFITFLGNMEQDNAKRKRQLRQLRNLLDKAELTRQEGTIKDEISKQKSARMESIKEVVNTVNKFSDAKMKDDVQETLIGKGDPKAQQKIIDNMSRESGDKQLMESYRDVSAELKALPAGPEKKAQEAKLRQQLEQIKTQLVERGAIKAPPNHGYTPADGHKPPFAAADLDNPAKLEKHIKASGARITGMAKEAGLDNGGGIVPRLHIAKQLRNEAGDGTATKAQLAALDKEIASLKAELDGTLKGYSGNSKKYHMAMEARDGYANRINRDAGAAKEMFEAAKRGEPIPNKVKVNGPLSERAKHAHEDRMKANKHFGEELKTLEKKLAGAKKDDPDAMAARAILKAAHAGAPFPKDIAEGGALYKEAKHAFVDRKKANDHLDAELKKIEVLQKTAGEVIDSLDAALMRHRPKTEEGMENQLDNALKTQVDLNDPVNKPTKSEVDAWIKSNKDRPEIKRRLALKGKDGKPLFTERSLAIKTLTNKYKPSANEIENWIEKNKKRPAMKQHLARTDKDGKPLFTEKTLAIRYLEDGRAGRSRAALFEIQAVPLQEYDRRIAKKKDALKDTGLSTEEKTKLQSELKVLQQKRRLCLVKVNGKDVPAPKLADTDPLPVVNDKNVADIESKLAKNIPPAGSAKRKDYETAVLLHKNSNPADQARANYTKIYLDEKKAGRGDGTLAQHALHRMNLLELKGTPGMETTKAAYKQMLEFSSTPGAPDYAARKSAAKDVTTTAQRALAAKLIGNKENRKDLLGTKFKRGFDAAAGYVDKFGKMVSKVLEAELGRLNSANEGIILSTRGALTAEMRRSQAQTQGMVNQMIQLMGMARNVQT